MPPLIAGTIGNGQREGEKESKGHRGVRRRQTAVPQSAQCELRAERPRNTVRNTFAPVFPTRYNGV